MATAQYVTRQANWIARNFECLDFAAAAAATADHIRSFWAPQLRDILLDEARTRGERFSPIARAGIATLARDRRPSAVDHSDA